TDDAGGLVAAIGLAAEVELVGNAAPHRLGVLAEHEREGVGRDQEDVHRSSRLANRPDGLRNRRRDGCGMLPPTDRILADAALWRYVQDRADVWQAPPDIGPHHLGWIASESDS